ncbi:MAG: helix-turn-helix domain-containing protein [Christensenella sp.]|nr:helix-turn-helix domain-containing protein [Christensenella sp.]
MQLNEIMLDQNLKELTKRGSPSFPIEMYDNDFGKLISGEFPWHWHYEVEFVFMLEGSVCAETQNGNYLLRKNDAVFFNSGTLHTMRPAEEGLCRAAIFVFDPQVIAGEPHSLIEQKYVQPFIRTHRSAVVFKEKAGKQKEILDLLHKTYRAFSLQEYGFEMEVRNCLSSVWLMMVRNNPVTWKGEVPNDIRIKKMLKYIHQHYMEDMTLKEIADSAGVSARECSRCFQKQIGMTAFTYLQKYRVRIAAEMLEDTRKSITDICFACGFNETSYFSKRFQLETGLTPREFRKKPSNMQSKRTLPHLAPTRLSSQHR